MNDDTAGIAVTMFAIAAILVLVGAGLFGYPIYKVWQQEKTGEAELRRSEWSKQIAIEEAKARLESATLDAASEVERAKGVAEANAIIGDSLRENEAYLRYLWINGLHDGSSEVIYVPTEANLPLLEATRQIQTPSQS